jgi:ribokinase
VEEDSVLVSAIGHLMLDVIVDAPRGLVPDDDTPATITLAAGGQAANVVTWARAYGARARLFGPRAASTSGQIVADALSAVGVDLHGPETERGGTVMSLVSGGARSMASDADTSDWLTEVRPGPWLDGADWLFVSGYALLHSPKPDQLVDLAATARSAGARVAVDLASAALVTAYGAAAFRDLWQAMRPAVVLANEAEWRATHSARSGGPLSWAGSGGTSVLVLKQGPRGCTFVIDGVADHREALATTVRDPTGAGDALAAGYMVGGVDLAMAAAARCVAQVGAQWRGAA